MPAQAPLKPLRPKSHVIGATRAKRQTDVLYEQEALVDQHRKALAEYRRVDYELRTLEDKCAETQAELDELEEGEAAQEGELGEEAAQIADLKKRLNQLESEIDQTEEELRQVRAASHSSVVGLLTTERDDLLSDNDRLADIVGKGNERVLANIRALAKVVSSDEYAEAVALEVKIDKLTRKQNYLRSVVEKKRLAIDAPGGVPKQTQQAKELREALRAKAEVDVTLERQEERKGRRPRKWDTQASKLITYIEELNEQLEALGVGDRVLDVEALKQRFVHGSG